MPKKKRIPIWIYAVVAIVVAGTGGAVVVIKTVIEPKMEAAARAATMPVAFDTISYQAQTIKLSKAYGSFDEYKSDPNNIAPSENARVQKLVTQARVRVSYDVNEGIDERIAELGFPGYAVRKLETALLHGSKREPIGNAAAFAIEIPRANQDRIIVFQHGITSRRWVLLDDFVGPKGIMDVRSKDGELQYCTLDGQILARHPPPP